MGRILTILIILITLIIPVAADSSDVNKTYNQSFTLDPNASQTFTLGETEAINYTVEINSSNVTQAYFQSDEGLSPRNYTRYTFNIDENNNGSDIVFQWDNQRPITFPTTIDWRPWIETWNGTYTANKSKSNTTIQIVSSPTIHGFKAEDVEQGDYSTIQLNVTHPVARGKLERVEFDITNPNGTDTYVARNVDDITKDGDEGVIYEAIYTRTDHIGDYDVEARIETDDTTVTGTTDFEVEEREADAPETELATMSVAGLNIFEAGAQLASITLWRNIYIFLQLLIWVPAIAVILGGAGYEEASYENLS